MKNFFAKKVFGCAVAGGLLCGAVVFSGCDDSSSAGGDETETNALSSAEEYGSSSSFRHCEDCKDEAISSSGKVTDKDSDAMSSDSKSNDPAEVTDDSSDSKDSPSSAGTSTKSSNSNTSGNDAKSSSSAGKEVSSSSEEMKTAWDYLNPNIDYGEFTDKRDGQVYKTVTIGDQTWMAQNLNYEVDSSWCYQRKTWNCEKYGRLYTWAAAIDSVKLVTDANNPQTCGFGGVTCSLPAKVQGVCPAGWHLPTDDEWNTLFKEIGGIFTAGVKFKSTSDWSNERCVSGYGTKDFNGTNDYGFSVLPAGDRNYYGVFSRLGRYAKFWSASEYSSDDAFYAYNWRFLCEYSSASREHSYKWYAYSVRCLKDSD